jgi:hypothetical protein
MVVRTGVQAAVRQVVTSPTCRHLDGSSILIESLLLVQHVGARLGTNSGDRRSAFEYNWQCSTGAPTPAERRTNLTEPGGPHGQP